MKYNDFTAYTLNFTSGVIITALIYFLEDDDSIRKLVSYALAKEGNEVKGFGSPSEFWPEYRLQKPELLLLDIMLPEEDGLSVLKKIRAESEIPVIMLTAKGSEFDKVTGLDSGADDYMAKPFGITELLSRVRAVLRRYRASDETEQIYKIGGLLVNPAKHTAELNGSALNLSYKEYGLLLALLEANGRVIRREELLSRVWGEFYGESRTLDVHIRSLRVKLGEAGDMIQTVKNVGYKISEQ